MNDVQGERIDRHCPRLWVTFHMQGYLVILPGCKQDYYGDIITCLTFYKQMLGRSRASASIFSKLGRY